ncbi:TolC family protein [Pseudarcicella hirudinis]|uniref:TolC family protein n=1 Tax=Pseudarcicella hirudinis TaxID=1079859 RepID=UPI0035E4A3F8
MRNRKLLVQIRQLHKNGVVLKTDVLRAELKLSGQKMNLLEIENSIDITSRKVAIITGLPDNTRIMVQSDSTNVSDFLPESYETYLAQALKQAFSYKISEKETELSFLKLKQVKTNAAPKIGLFAEYTYAYPQIQFYPYANAAYALGQYGVKASFPISALYQNKHKEEAARLNILQHELAHSDLGDGIRQQVHESYVRYKESLSRIEVAKNNIVQATENLRIINNTYFNQLALLTDLLDAETQVLQARFDLTSAQIIAQEQYYQLQKTIGNL